MLIKIFSFFINRPFFTIGISLVITLFFTTFIPRVSIDASAETLLLDNDKDLIFSREINKKFTTPNFLIVTYSPHSKLLSQKSINTLEKIIDELENIDGIKDSISILNAPLLQSPPVPVKELVKNIPTLKSSNIDKTLAKKEFLTSPLYKNNLVSKDFQTTAIVLRLKDDTKYDDFIAKRDILKKKTSPTQEEETKLQQIIKDFKIHRDMEREKNHLFIQEIRFVLAKYQKEAKLFLGGVNMIADDMVTYVKSDVLIYGSVLFILLIVTLWSIFRQIRFVILPVLICTVSVVITTGLLGLLNLEITVISSNFVSLQLIITLSIALHLIVQYRELVKKYSKSTQKRVILATLLTKANPSFFAIITTIVGFGSLVFSGIKPIINLGYMMSLGIFVSLIVSFVLFGSLNALFEKIMPKPRLNSHFSLTALSAYLVKNHGNFILLASGVVFAIGIYGALKIKVENSFINYFKSSTEIYKGMEVIDTKLGGTTPLDIILTFKEQKENIDETSALSEFEEEFLETKNDEQYWFTRVKMELIGKIHNYLSSLDEIGNVQSLDTLMQVGQKLNDGKDLDSFELALIYNELPLKFKDMILSPYINIKHNEARFSTRIIDSNPNLRRDAFLKKVNKDLKEIIPEDVAVHKLSGLMVLYNNMLQSLFRSQIVTLGFVVLALTLMFWILFRSLQVAIIAMVSNIIPMSFLFGFMGLGKIPLDMMSITIAAISIGIGVDDTIHYLHRFKWELKHTKNYGKAMENSHKTIGYAMFYTSFAIILGFSVLVVSNFIPTIYFGLLTVLVMVMVLLGALLLLPKLLIIFKPFRVPIQ